MNLFFTVFKHLWIYLNWSCFGRNLFFNKKTFHTINKPYVAFYSKKHLELRSIIDFLFFFQLVEFLFVFVLTVNFLMFSCIEFPFREI